MTVGFSQSMYPVSENDTAVEICVHILEGSLAADREVVVEVESLSGTATGKQTDHCTWECSHLRNSFLTAEDDYVPFNRTFTLTNMKTFECFDVEITKDTLFEADETFMVLLSSNDFSATLMPDSAVIIIQDDDGMPFFYYYLPFLDSYFLQSLFVDCFDACTFKPKSVFQAYSF